MQRILKITLVFCAFMLAGLVSVPDSGAVPGDFLFLWGAPQHLGHGYGIAVDGSDNVYVTVGHTIQVFNSSGIRIKKWGGFGSGDGQLIYPVGIAVDGSGTAYVADTSNGRVQVFDRDGRFLRKWSFPGFFPWYIATDGRGMVYVTDESSVKVFDSGGNFIRELEPIHPRYPDVLWYVNGLAADHEGRAYVVDYETGRVHVYAPDGKFLRSLECYGISGITVDASGYLYVADRQSPDGLVAVYDGDGRWIKNLGAEFGPGQESDVGPSDHYWSPRALAVDSKGNLYTLDNPIYYLDGVRVFDPAGVELPQWWSYGAGPGQMSRPRGIFVDRSGNVYETDGHDDDTGIRNNRVQVFGPDGNFRAKWTGSFAQTAGIAADVGGSVYVLDSFNPDTSVPEWRSPTSIAKVFDSAGNFLKEWGDPRENPDYYGIAIDKNGNFVVSERTMSVVEIYDREGNFLSTLGSAGTGDAEFSRPAGIAVDQDGSIFVVDSGNSRIQKFDAAYRFIGTWGSRGSDDGQFADPAGMAIDRGQHLFVADTGNNRIQIFDISGGFLGRLGIPPPDEGWPLAPDDDGVLYGPEGVAVDSSGQKVYVADSRNNRIQVFEGYGWPSYSMSGTVHEATTTGRLLAGATVSIADKTTTTDSAGAFSITEITAGAYTLTIGKAGYPTMITPGYVIDSNQSGLSFALPTTSYTISGTVREASANAPPLVGASVSIAGKTTTTDSTGAFRIQEIGSGTYTLTVSKMGYLTKTITGYLIESNHSSLLFSLTPSFTVSGTVREDSDVGGPLARATVSIGDKSTTTNSTGAFSITDLACGTYTVTITKTGYFAKTNTSYTINGNQSGVVFSLQITSFTLSGIVRESAMGPLVRGATVSVAGKTTSTDSNGAYSISGIVAGEYGLTMTHPGYPTKTIAYGINGDQRAALHFFPLLPEASLSGTVYTGSAYTPLPGATVSIADNSVMTSSTGTFRVPDVPPGSYYSSVTKNGYYPNAFIFGVGGHQTGLVFVLTPGTCSFRGVVQQTSAAGAVIPGATVAVAGKTVTTSSTGAFSFTDIPVGIYTVTISKDGYVTNTTTGYDLYGDRDTGFYLTPVTYSLSGTVREESATGPVLTGATVAVAGKAATTSGTGTFNISGIPAGTYTLTVSKAGYLTNTITGYEIKSNSSGLEIYVTPLSNSLSGTVRQGSASGAVIPGATVAVAGKTATTTSTGAFSFTDIPTGTYTVTISKAGYVTDTITGYQITSNSSGLEFYLTPETYSLSGTVRQGSATGPVLAGATAAIAGKTAATTSTGAFSITGIPAGTYTLIILKAGCVTKAVTGYVVNSNQSGLTFYLAPAYSISGTVRADSLTGPVLPGATVAIAGRTTTTSSTGTFSISGIPAGTYTLTISKSGYATRTVTCFVVSGNRTGLVHYLLPAYSISGTVRQGSATGPVLAGAKVAIAGKSVLTSSTGTFSITGIPSGTYTLIISKSGYATKGVTGYVVNGNKSGLVFFLSPAYSISGTVRIGSATGPVLAGAKVAIAGQSVITGSTGAFSITGIPAGSYTLTISRTPFVSKTVTGFVVNGNKSGLVFYLTLPSAGQSREGGAVARAGFDHPQAQGSHTEAPRPELLLRQRSPMSSQVHR